MFVRGSEGQVVVRWKRRERLVVGGLAIAALATLERWTCAALTARTAAAVFDDKRAAKAPRNKR